MKQFVTNKKTRYWLLLALLAVLLALKFCKSQDALPQLPGDDAVPPAADTLVQGGGTAGEWMDVDAPAALGETVVRRYTGYTAYYSPRHRVPRCTVYEFTRGELTGKASRDGVLFRDDPTVKDCAWSSDYKGSGYTRGHMTPAGDMKWNQRALEETFYTTNICPQLKEMNEGAWGDLEKKVREWTRRDKALIVITGPVLTDGMKTIGRKHRVAVPQRFFKVVLAHKVEPMRAIAFIYDHKPEDSAPLRRHAVSVDSIEALTGLDFFHRLPAPQQAALERDTNIDKWL